MILEGDIPPWPGDIPRIQGCSATAATSYAAMVEKITRIQRRYTGSCHLFEQCWDSEFRTGVDIRGFAVTDRELKMQRVLRT